LRDRTRFVRQGGVTHERGVSLGARGVSRGEPVLLINAKPTNPPTRRSKVLKASAEATAGVISTLALSSRNITTTRNVLSIFMALPPSSSERSPMGQGSPIVAASTVP